MKSFFTNKFAGRGGFTLVEIVASIAIMGVSLAIVLESNKQSMVERQKADSYTRVLTYEGLLRRQIYATIADMLEKLRSGYSCHHYRRNGEKRTYVNGEPSGTQSIKYYAFLSGWGDFVPRNGAARFAPPPVNNPLFGLKLVNLAEAYAAKVNTPKSKFIREELLTRATQSVYNVIVESINRQVPFSNYEYVSPQSRDGLGAVFLIDLGSDFSLEGAFTKGTPTVIATMAPVMYDYGKDSEITCDDFHLSSKRGIRVKYALVWDVGGEKMGQAFDAKVGYVDVGDGL